MPMRPPRRLPKAERDRRDLLVGQTLSRHRAASCRQTEGGGGARSIVLAGHPGDNEQAWRAAGVDRFIFMKCDVLETLRELLREQGVMLKKESQPNE